MNNSHNALIESLKNLVSWICTGIGWAMSDITLSRAALITSIIYSIVNVWIVLERRAKKNAEEN
jgi:hypothetical protein